MKSDRAISSPPNGNGSPSALARLRRKLSPRRSDSKQLSLSPSSSTRSSSSELQKVFNYLDENGDGKICAAELQRCVMSLGGELSAAEAESAVRSSDLDGDGLLGFGDFLGLMESSSSFEEELTLRQAFGMYETEPGSGIINPNSLKRVLSRLGDSTSLDRCKAMIRTFDLNGDGVLTFNEFAIMMR